ncbi:hypothetical protein [Streptomyces scabiei]|uniref:hypothetical protein n=1 Tax=Streptomyces scabiei TaxID=1930 RepID=UPI000A37E16E|nr:hypothetical protein [Streptomyces scabiei]
MRFVFKPSLKERSSSTATTIKRTALVGTLSLASVLAFVQPASAATNIRGQEPWNTDKLLMSICTGSKKTTYWKINIKTGEVQKDPTGALLASGKGVRTNLPAPWEVFEGNCSYPKSSSWTWNGPFRRVSNTVTNCSKQTTLRHELTSSGSTTSTTSHSVSGSFGIEWSILKDVLAVEAGGSYTHTWSYAKTKGWSETTGIAVEYGRTAWWGKSDIMRTVRSNPVFHVKKYAWGDSNNGYKPHYATTWRGRSYRDIKSQGAYYDAKANVLNSQGMPAGEIKADGKAAKC